MRIRMAVPDQLVGPDTLEPALENTTRVNEAMMLQGIVPRFTTALRSGRVRWQPEPKGHGEHFDGADTVLARGWGDCDDLAPWYAAQLRVQGTDPGARAIVRPSGPGRWHALVRRTDGSLEDPSRAAGMGQRQAGDPHVDHGIDRHTQAGAVTANVARWPRVGELARVDLPLDPYASASHYAVARDPQSALLEACISGACNGIVLGVDDDEILEHACQCGALASRLCGMPESDASERWGGVEVGSIFGKIAHAVTAPLQAAISAPAAVANTALQAAQVIPGASHILPIAQQALAPALALPQMAMPAIQSVLQSGIPLAQQLMPLFAASGALPTGGMSLPLMLALMGMTQQ